MSVLRLAPPSSSPRSAPASTSVPLDAEALSSDQLLRGRREILIRHGDRVYRLRHTSNDKLILTK
ncbi:hemin uptake protein HemP [Pseudoxanthomonas suwonensis]|jgi:Hemin uptake protein|uniref:hemin uptake protein HemP n=1 Tax=Pseudoxanthomonas suwonensis TaxID=314722 RepID=UPI00138F2A97|nr:hemin uptake protein HemP [Pseudoxanthomonas suwonensis]KAF1705653.1 hemic uptake protein hemP [Pseudoxanthomonas suwonensis]